MKISKKGDYALRALIHLALRHGEGITQMQDIARKEGIPGKFLEQILLLLKGAGYLQSRSGVGGGYIMAKAPKAITLGEIVRLIDGPLAPVPCAAERPAEACTCPEPRTCPVRLMMLGIRREMSALFDGRTVEDMLRLAPGAGTLAFDI